MTQEDKAKAYDKALEKARQLMGYPPTQPFISDLKDLFPELAKSEDEKIRYFLIDFIKVCSWTEKKDQGWPLKEDAIAWLEKQGEQKSKWSEEDEKMLSNVIDTVKDATNECDCDDVGTKARMALEKEYNWLKSLRPQKHWKPSEEQMEDLKEAADNYPNPDVTDSLYEIYRELKAL